MEIKEVVIKLIREDMRYNQYMALLRKLGIEVYFSDLELSGIVADLMGQEMTCQWIELYFEQLSVSELLPIKPLGKNLEKPAEECYDLLQKFKKKD